ncbi:hypothetical protein [Francisella philomiragia]|uniref:hypothetical protein n=1 Tax=Francisella philomiragia TaxID=28110 RepID=UPI001C9DF977|nr:hypothetical protein [Francisella philomiragia]MBY7735056.1 hypothetical protein [Francisella philomiragia]
MINIKKLSLIPLSIFFLNYTALAAQVEISVSTDGKYAVSADGKQNTYLYNLSDKKINRINSNKVNPYSPNFIEDTDNFIYQDTDNKVYIVNADTQKVIKSFQGVPKSFNQAVNKDMNIYTYMTRGGYIHIAKIVDGKLKNTYSYGNQFMNMQMNTIPKFYDNKVIATTSKDSLLIFDLDKVFKDDKYTPIKISENSGATVNAISPDGRYVYTLDNRALGIKYDLKSNKQVIFKDNTQNPNNFALNFSDESQKVIQEINRIKMPIKIGTNFKFIDKDKILATGSSTQPFLWVGLYDINIKQMPVGKDFMFATMPIIKYLPLTKDPLKFMEGNYRNNTDPYPSLGDYNTTFDTSVKAHKLVTSSGRGIMVYNYNPSDETLKLDWVGEPPKVEEKKEEKSKGWFW